MQIGGIYNCKRFLFGIAIDLSDEDAIKQSRIICETTDRELFVCEMCLSSRKCIKGARKSA